jgi:hypothetical protein
MLIRVLLVVESLAVIVKRGDSLFCSACLFYILICDFWEIVCCTCVHIVLNVFAISISVVYSSLFICCFSL